MRYKGGVISATAPDTTTSKGVWTIRQQLQAIGGGVWPTVPNAPTIGSATAGDTTASVTFTAPSSAGYPATITGYTVTSSPGGLTGTGSSSPITVSGLTNGTAYTFTVTATNATGRGPASAASNSVTPNIVVGQQDYSSIFSSTFTWVAPAGVTSVSLLLVGGGGPGIGANYNNRYSASGGGALAYKNNLTVVPGNSYTVRVGPALIPTIWQEGVSGQEIRAGAGGYYVFQGTAPGGTPSGAYTAGFNGGASGTWSTWQSGGGGAAGYAGAGGAGGNGGSTSGVAGSSGSGGGGGGGGGATHVGAYPSSPYFGYGGGGGGGGGVGNQGQGASGAGGAGGTQAGGLAEFGGPGVGGSGGTDGTGGYNAGGGTYGGGGADANGGRGILRIIWPGNLRFYPSTRTADE